MKKTGDGSRRQPGSGYKNEESQFPYSNPGPNSL